MTETKENKPGTFREGFAVAVILGVLVCAISSVVSYEFGKDAQIRRFAISRCYETGKSAVDGSDGTVQCVSKEQIQNTVILTTDPPGTVTLNK